MIKDVGPASLGKPQETQGNPSRPYFMSFFKTTLSHTVVSETAVWRFEWSITNIISTIKLQTQIIEKFYGVHICKCHLFEDANKEEQWCNLPTAFTAASTGWQSLAKTSLVWDSLAIRTARNNLLPSTACISTWIPLLLAKTTWMCQWTSETLRHALLQFTHCNIPSSRSRIRSRTRSRSRSRTPKAPLRHL